MLKFEISLENSNLVMAALGKQPYEAVYQLIAELQRQAAPQLAPPLPAGSVTTVAEPLPVPPDA